MNSWRSSGDVVVAALSIGLVQGAGITESPQNGLATLASVDE
jgi:hypothetical protein